MKTFIAILLTAIVSVSLTINVRAQNGGEYDPTLPMAPSLPSYGPSESSDHYDRTDSRPQRTSYDGNRYRPHDRTGHTEKRYDTIKTVSESGVGPEIFRQPRYAGPESLKGLTHVPGSEIPGYLFLNDMNNGGVELDQAKDAWFWCLKIKGMWIPLYIDHCILDGHDYKNRVNLTQVPCPKQERRHVSAPPPPCRECEVQRQQVPRPQYRPSPQPFQPFLAMLPRLISQYHSQPIRQQFPRMQPQQQPRPQPQPQRQMAGPGIVLTNTTGNYNSNGNYTTVTVNGVRR